MNADLDPCCVSVAQLDPRYVEGLRLFNEAEFFAAHDVWEDLWGKHSESFVASTRG